MEKQNLNIAKHWAISIKRYITSKRNLTNKKTKYFSTKIHSKILALNEYQKEITKTIHRYPRFKYFNEILILYIELECETLTNFESDKNIIATRVLNLLKYVMIPNFTKTLFVNIQMDKYVLNFLRSIQYKCRSNIKLLINTIRNLIKDRQIEIEKTGNKLSESYNKRKRQQNITCSKEQILVKGKTTRNIIKRNICNKKTVTNASVYHGSDNLICTDIEKNAQISDLQHICVNSKSEIEDDFKYTRDGTGVVTIELDSDGEDFCAYITHEVRSNKKVRKQTSINKNGTLRLNSSIAICDSDSDKNSKQTNVKRVNDSDSQLKEENSLVIIDSLKKTIITYEDNKNKFVQNLYETVHNNKETQLIGENILEIPTLQELPLEFYPERNYDDFSTLDIGCLSNNFNFSTPFNEISPVDKGNTAVPLLKNATSKSADYNSNKLNNDLCNFQQIHFPFNEYEGLNAELSNETIDYF